MRVVLTLAVAVTLFGVMPLSAQQKEKVKPMPVIKSRDILASMKASLAGLDPGQQIKFSEALELAQQRMKEAGKDVNIVIDDEAFRDEYPDLQQLANHDIPLRGLPAKTTVAELLRMALKRLPVKAAMVVRAGRVDIVPQSRTSKEYMLNQTFHVDFTDKKLDAALEELSELTGVSIVMDARAKQKMQTAVTARFMDDIALQDAVRMLTDMAELKIVYLVTGIYITTPEHAKEMQKELKDLYEPRVPAGAGRPPGAGGAGAPPPDMIAPFDPFGSPLAPPLPPSRKRLDPAAAA